MPNVSIIIPMYNAEKYIKEAIDSVLKQTYKDFEIIVIDDGSTDNTKSKLLDYGSQIKYIYQENAGPAVARNRGIKEAKGEYIAFLDADDIWMPEKLERQIRKLKNNSEFGVIHTDRLRLEPDGSVKPNEKIVPEGFIFEELLRNNFIICSSVLVKKECFNEVGLFDEDRKNRAEDYDMWLRISRKYAISFIAEPLIKYRVNMNGYNRSNIKAMYDSVKRVFLKSIEFYEGDKRQLKKERFYCMARRKASAFFYIKEYRKAFLAFCESLGIRYLEKV